MGVRCLVCVLMLVWGCGHHSSGVVDDADDEPGDASGSGGGAEAGADAPTDGGVDGMDDAAPDAMDDAGVDGVTDAGADAMDDAAIDAAAPDAAIDAGIDAPIDAAPDAAIDAAIDAPIDAAIDAPSCTSGVMPAFCSNGCTDLNVDPLNCGQCGTSCPSMTMCVAGGCVPICGGATPNICNNSCTNTQSDPNNCGQCGTQCGSGQICTAGACVPDCQAPTPDLCNGTTCVDLQTDAQHCGMCQTPCGTGEQCTAGACECAPATPDTCNGACTNKQTDNANCGQCGMVCPVGTICSGGTCQLDCQSPFPDECNGACTDVQQDPAHCGDCGTQCAAGASCFTGACVCPVSKPNECNGACVDTNKDAANCGACGHACGATEHCAAGICCGAGQSSCNNACADTQTDVNNCGGCGNTCAADQTCIGGSCVCPFGQSECNGACVPTATDPNNCGGCGNTCPAGQACVSNGCSTTCPPPLTKCGNECIDLKTDSRHCGSCSNAACSGNTGCDDGACVPVVPLNPPPPKCTNGGPPIVVPTGGDTSCTGNLSSTAFTYALCSRTDIGPLSQPVTTDAYDSTQGPYVAGQKGGSIGVNGTISDTAALAIGGDLRVGSSSGMTMKGDITIRERFYDLGALGMSKLLSIQEDAFIAGPITASGATMGSISGTLTTPACGSVPAALAYGGCTSGSVAFGPPCGTALDTIPVRQIVQYFEDPAHNDNATIGLDDNVLASPPGAIRLDLPCGYYHLTSIGGSMPVTIVAHGHTALFVSGAINSSKPFYIDLDVDSTFDIFVGGVVVSAQAVSVGNPAYPRLSRVYIGSPSCAGSGTCTANSDCCSGVCASGHCTGSGGGLANSLKLSGGSTFLNGLFYAGFGEIRISNDLEMYGALFANYYEASGPTFIHYDQGAVENGDECPPPTECQSCGDCNNQACNAGVCGACDSDAACCQPLRCVNPGPNGHCALQ